MGIFPIYSKTMTLNSLFMERFKGWGEETALKFKEGGRYRDISWRTFGERVKEVSLGLLSFGLNRGDRVGLMSRNRPQWLYSDLGIIMAGGITVPIYTTLAPEQIAYIMNDSGARLLILEGERELDKVLKVREKLPHLERTILIEPPKGQVSGIISFQALLEEGRGHLLKSPSRFEEMAGEAREEEPVTIIYTSGTTGPPKGVVLSHKNFISGCLAAHYVLPTRKGDVALSFLPLAHVYERYVTFTNLEKGVVVAFAERPEMVMENLPEVAPTVLFSVPRFFERIYQRLMAQVSRGSILKRAIFSLALRWGMGAGDYRMAKERVPPHLAFPDLLAQRLVFSKLKRRLGGRVRFFVSGGAPLSDEVARFFYAAHLPILQGYGLTESCAVCSVNNFEDFKLGSVGKPCPAVKVKIAEDGEILIKGDVVFSHYWNKPEETEKALKDGWLHTGDVGHITDDGFLVITDRKKDMLALASGQKVSPQNVEGLLRSSRFINEVVVYGDKLPYLTALIALNLEEVGSYAKERGIAFESPEELLSHPKVKALIKSIVEEGNQRLAPHERIRKFEILPKDFTLDSDELTPTLKVRRHVIFEKYKEMLESMYRR